jgi:hypothetical protein
MAEAGKTQKKPASTSKSGTAPSHEPVKLADFPALDDQTLTRLFNWLHTIDDVRIAGHQNKVPRWVYVVALLWVIF